MGTKPWLDSCCLGRDLVNPVRGIKKQTGELQVLKKLIFFCRKTDVDKKESSVCLPAYRPSFDTWPTQRIPFSTHRHTVEGLEEEAPGSTVMNSSHVSGKSRSICPCISNSCSGWYCCVWTDRGALMASAASAHKWKNWLVGWWWWVKHQKLACDCIISFI